MRFCSTCGRRLDVDGAHGAATSDRQAAITKVFAALIAAMVLAAGVAAYVLTRPDDEDPMPASSPRPPAVADEPSASPLEAWRELAATLPATAAASELATTDGNPTIATFSDGEATVWRFTSGEWRPTRVALVEPPLGTSVSGAALQLLEVTGDGEPDVVIGTSGTATRATAVLSSDGGSWRALEIEEGGAWAEGLVVDDGQLRVDPACSGACTPSAPAGPWLALRDDGRLVSTDQQPPLPLTEAEEAAAIESLENALVADLGEADGLLCTRRPTLLVPGVELRCTWPQRPPRLLQVRVAPGGELTYDVIGAFELR